MFYSQQTTRVNNRTNALKKTSAKRDAQLTRQDVESGTRTVMKIILTGEYRLKQPR